MDEEKLIQEMLSRLRYSGAGITEPGYIGGSKTTYSPFSSLAATSTRISPFAQRALDLQAEKAAAAKARDIHAHGFVGGGQGMPEQSVQLRTAKGKTPFVPTSRTSPRTNISASSARPSGYISGVPMDSVPRAITDPAVQKQIMDARLEGDSISLSEAEKRAGVAPTSKNIGDIGPASNTAQDIATAEKKAATQLLSDKNWTGTVKALAPFAKVAGPVGLAYDVLRSEPAVASTEALPGGYFYESQAYPSMDNVYTDPTAMAYAGVTPPGEEFGSSYAGPNTMNAQTDYNRVKAMFDSPQMVQDWGDPTMMSAPTDPTGGLAATDPNLQGITDESLVSLNPVERFIIDPLQAKSVAAFNEALPSGVGLAQGVSQDAVVDALRHGFFTQEWGLPLTDAYETVSGLLGAGSGFNAMDYQNNAALQDIVNQMSSAPPGRFRTVPTDEEVSKAWVDNVMIQATDPNSHQLDFWDAPFSPVSFDMGTTVNPYSDYLANPNITAQATIDDYTAALAASDPALQGITPFSMASTSPTIQAAPQSSGGGGGASRPQASAPMAPRQDAMPVAPSGPTQAEIEAQIAAAEQSHRDQQASARQALRDFYGSRAYQQEGASAPAGLIDMATEVDSFAGIAEQGGGYQGGYEGMGGFEGYR